MPKTGEKNREKINTEISVSHKNSTDFVNSGTLFDQRLVDSYFTSNLSTSLLNLKLSNNKKDNLTLSTGLLTNWEDGKPYHNDQRERSLTSLTTSKTFELKNDYQISFSAAGVYVPTDGKGPTVSFLNPEVKLSHNNYFTGIGGIAGQNVTENQLFLFGGYKGLRINLGAYDIKSSENKAEFRAMASYDLKISDKSKAQFFGSAETGEQGAERLGAIYQTKFKNISFRSDLIFNSSTANYIENANARADIPFSLSKKDKHSLSGAINLFAGVAGEFKTAKNPEPSLNPVYGLGFKLNLFDSKNR